MSACPNNRDVDPNYTRHDADQQPREFAASDLAFKRAMLAARKSGAEHVEIGVKKSRAQNFVRIVRATPTVPLASSAGFTADYGAVGDGAHRILAKSLGRA